jgi:Xaa-Pro aminopeptidase
VKVKIRSPFHPQRPVKSADEVNKISAAITMAEVGLAEAIQAIKRAKADRDGLLHLAGSTLTCARVRAIIETAVLQAGGTPVNAVVGCSWRTHDPVRGGDGPLVANQPVTLTVSPRSRKTGYFGELARTVVKGRASEGVRRLFHTVKTARTMATGLLTPGLASADVHRAVRDYFAREGFATLHKASPKEGFHTPIGHGLGLELHEAPFLDHDSPEALRAGHVVTIEPSLHYPALGCVRLVDAALVGTKGARHLAKFETVLEV